MNIITLENKLKIATTLKRDAIIHQHYEDAAKYRDIERKLENLILRKDKLERILK